MSQSQLKLRASDPIDGTNNKNQRMAILTTTSIDLKTTRDYFHTHRVRPRRSEAQLETMKVGATSVTNNSHVLSTLQCTELRTIYTVVRWGHRWNERLERVTTLPE